MAGGGETILIDELIETCIQILKKHRPIQSFSFPIVGLLREMAITLEHVQKLKLSKTQALSNLDRFQTETRNKMLNIRREPREPQDLRIERDNNAHRLQSLLIQIESHKRSALAQYGQVERELETRLTQLLNRYDAITMNNGDA